MAKKEKVFVSIQSLSDEQKRRLKGVITEVAESLTRVAAEKDLQKDAIEDIATEFEIDKKLVKKLATTFYRDSYEQDVEAFESFENWYDGLLKGK